MVAHLGVPRGVLWLLGATSVVACGRGSSGESGRSAPVGAPPSSVGVANLQPTVDVTSTLERVSAALCDHAMACTRGGPPPFASRATCLDEMRGSLAEGLNSATCPGGLDSAQVAVCLKTIDNQDCGQPAQSDEPVDQCSSGALCSKH